MQKWNPERVILATGATKIINLSLVEQVDSNGELAILTMSSGEKLTVANPRWSEWMNDVLKSGG